MNILNIEIKAQCNTPEQIRTILEEQNADFKGTDHQVDTYFNIPDGRLKLRQGSIEQNLIYYRRKDSKNPKPSDINLLPVQDPDSLLALLTNALGIKTVVEKEREIYFIDNVKFHIDQVEELGNFIEIEAIDEDGLIGEEKLLQQCNHYLELFDISENDLVAESYSDMLMD
jgi:predicted adenylyl cyclase CyaB